MGGEEWASAGGFRVFAGASRRFHNMGRKVVGDLEYGLSVDLYIGLSKRDISLHIALFAFNKQILEGYAIIPLEAQNKRFTPRKRKGREK
jgi:hypothetical protein